jgi:trk system potassium uptake protein TrkH
VLEGMETFDAACHSLTTLSTGGFSPHDNSIAYYRIIGHANYRLIEYTIVGLMILGGMSFVVHYRFLTGKIRSLWDTIEMRYWWRLMGISVLLIGVERLYRTGLLAALCSGDGSIALAGLESTFRDTLFQVVSMFTTTGFVTRSIGSDYFFAMAKQFFLVMMLIGGCVGSTAGGFKVQRIAILARLMSRELFMLRVSPRASSQLVMDGKVVTDEAVRRVATLFFTWVTLLLFGGAITAAFTDHGAFESFSGMFSALGNIGPCYISIRDLTELPAVVKMTYMFGMLAGRLELLPVLLIFSRKAWR